LGRGGLAPIAPYDYRYCDNKICQYRNNNNDCSNLLSRYCYGVQNTYLATKVGVHIIDTYLCICVVIDNIQAEANMMNIYKLLCYIIVFLYT